MTGTLILGNSVATLQQAKQWARQNNATQKFIDIADLYWKIAPEYGVRADIAYAQSAKETNFGKFTGVLDESFHNWCGMKTPSGGSDSAQSSHTKFPSDEVGIRAHIQHLAWYAGVDIKDEIVDPRHFSWIKGVATTVEGLNGRWAPSSDYGESVVNNYLNPMLSIVIIPEPQPEPVPVPVPAPIPPTPEPEPTPEVPKGLIELIADFITKLFRLFGIKK